jgi:hypothetical protein
LKPLSASGVLVDAKLSRKFITAVKDLSIGKAARINE